VSMLTMILEMRVADNSTIQRSNDMRNLIL
jgi:hypothetical protein